MESVIKNFKTIIYNITIIVIIVTIRKIRFLLFIKKYLLQRGNIILKEKITTQFRLNNLDSKIKWHSILLSKLLQQSIFFFSDTLYLSYKLHIKRYRCFSSSQ